MSSEETLLTKQEIRDEVENVVEDLCVIVGMDRPENFEEIIDFIVEDVFETSSVQSDGFFSRGDVIIGFRRFIENK